MMEQFKVALRAGDVDGLQRLVHEAAQVGMDLAALRNDEERHLAHLAVEHGTVPAFLAVFDPLLRGHEREFLDARTGFGETPLHLAAINGDTDSTRALLAYWADVTSLDDFGNSALHCAAIGGNAEVATMLLDAHVPLERNDQHQTPADTARERGHFELAERLQALYVPAEPAVGDGLAGGASEEVVPSLEAHEPGHWKSFMRAIQDNSGFATPAGSASVQSNDSVESMASVMKAAGGAAPG